MKPGGHDYTFGGLNHCGICGGSFAWATSQCPGKLLTDEQRNEVESGSLDYHRDKWWIADTGLRYSVQAVEAESLSPCSECKGIPAFDSPSFGDPWKIALGCFDPDCPNDGYVMGSDRSSVVRVWNKRQSDAQIVPSKAVSPESTSTLSPDEKIDSRASETSLRERVDKLEQTVDDILRGRVSRRYY